MTTTQQSYREIWTEIDNPDATAEQQRCIRAAEENASDTSIEDDGFDLHSEDWYRVALATYEFLIDNGTFTLDEKTQMSTEPIALHNIPGTAASELHAAGVLCPACEREEADAEWAALSPAERIRIRWDNARIRIGRIVRDRRPGPPF